MNKFKVGDMVMALESNVDSSQCIEGEIYRVNRLGADLPIPSIWITVPLRYGNHEMIVDARCFKLVTPKHEQVELPGMSPSKLLKDVVCILSSTGKVHYADKDPHSHVRIPLCHTEWGKSVWPQCSGPVTCKTCLKIAKKRFNL